jgi:hypothetical protein
MRLVESKRFRCFSGAARFGAGDYHVVQLAMKSPCSDLAPFAGRRPGLETVRFYPSAVTFSCQFTYRRAMSDTPCTRRNQAKSANINSPRPKTVAPFPSPSFGKDFVQIRANS